MDSSMPDDRQFQVYYQQYLKHIKLKGLQPKTIDAYSRAIRELGKNCEWIFPSPQTKLPYVQRNKWMQKYCAIAEVKPFGIHAIRHLTASILLKNDVSLIDIKTILRHKSLVTTERYLHRLHSVRSALEIVSQQRAKR